MKPLMVYREDEGVTVIIEKEVADEKRMSYSGTWALITLTVHSSLEVVGFLAKITTKLAEKCVSVNAVSAYYHDHLFVPFEKKEVAMRSLLEL